MIIGIDLGTTNSSVAYWESGEVKVIPNALGELLTPSVISLIKEDDTILIGKPALYRMVTHPEDTIASFKRYMGSDKTFRLGDYTFRPEELSALILSRLKEDAEKFLGYKVEEAIISVPAYFSDAQRKATKIAGKLAGLRIERLINEPTAAGIAYGLQERINETNYLIFDLGGGTFDVSILTMFSGIIEVCASSGDNLLGGLDFTNILRNLFIENLKNQKLFKDKNLPIILEQKIYEQAEFAKHKLSNDSEIIMKVTWNSQVFEYKLTIKDFESHADELLQRIRRVILKVLNDSNLSSTQIEQVILVGGATRMSIIRKLVGRMFGKFPLTHINPDTVVVAGAAIQAGLKANDKALEEIVVTDVCPYSLGIAVHNPTADRRDSFQFDPIIERNTIVPTSRSRIYYPIHPEQKYVEVKIYQGEHFFIEKNIFLGQLEIDLRRPVKDQAIEIRFTYDINGLLEVEATILETKEKSSIVIEGNPGVLNEEQIKKSLKELQKIKIHPLEQTENVLILSQAERYYEELHGEKRAYLANIMREFISVLNIQDARRIHQAREQLVKILVELQPDYSLM